MGTNKRKVTIGIDPGQSGALAHVVDGVLAAVVDMPTRPVLSKAKRAKKSTGAVETDPIALGAVLLQLATRIPNAVINVAIERVASMPDQGVASMFKFGTSYGIAQGVAAGIAAAHPQLEIRLVYVSPVKWKKDFGLIGTKKDDARKLAMKMWSEFEEEMKLVKNGGRADAVFIAMWANRHVLRV
jgi:crossover junction endodeoxyribonuclease RuvC